MGLLLHDQPPSNPGGLMSCPFLWLLPTKLHGISSEVPQVYLDGHLRSLNPKVRISYIIPHFFKRIS